ncbi:putative tRNA(Ile)-lysidine synthase [Colletotrichum shisoi]|uniref:tRNA(Ile)-lysidine synthetase n=1 Tax=Colletotrichum shisoi TaxID=2078593 RepID=A0A5Q4C6W9_9PEZI|nr:putative tRNA(Ile)-lysidine synthase [Colletotrichum shisoi]
MGSTNSSLASATAAAVATKPKAVATHQFLHPVPKPITFVEFLDAVRAATPPRFPLARISRPRRIGLAVSGGVDSMALAFLFSRLRERMPLMRIVDNPLTKLSAFIVDHRLREGSADEALAVANEVRKLSHIRPHVETINWKLEGIEGDPAAAPNLESIARRARYHRLGRMCATLRVESLFLAHHQDDQYETVLMRLLAGHGSRGLRGIAVAANIPECYDMHNVYESGHVDDQRAQAPLVSFRLPKKDWASVRKELSSELDTDLYGVELRAGLQMGWHESPYLGGGVSDALFSAASSAKAKARAAKDAAAARNMPQIHSEDAGIMVYRPLLGFPKDRLVATCEANKVRWFEDATNKDRTLTMRNAVRHLVREHALPRALGRDHVLRLAARCDARVRGQEWEAGRWIRDGVKADLEPNVGTLVIELPGMGVPGRTAAAAAARKSIYDDTRRELRLAHRRLIAALMVRKLVALVSPDRNPPQLASLQTAFNQASVLFLPVGPRKWYLVREPYPSLQPQPELTFTTVKNTYLRQYPTFPPTKWQTHDQDGGSVKEPVREAPPPAPVPPIPSNSARQWHSWQRFQLWDGRFWVCVKGRVKAVFRVAPFSPVHGRVFRERLGEGEAYGNAPETPKAPVAPAETKESAATDNNNDDKDDNYYCSGGGVGGFGSARIGVTGGDRGASTTPDKDGRARLEGILKRFAPGKVRYTLPALYAVHRDNETGEEVLRMLALPTLGIGLPGLERWVQYEVRYRKIDRSLLDDPSFGGSLRRRAVPRGGAAALRKKVLEEGIAEERGRRRIGAVGMGRMGRSGGGGGGKRSGRRSSREWRRGRFPSDEVQNKKLG